MEDYEHIRIHDNDEAQKALVHLQGRKYFEKLVMNLKNLDSVRIDQNNINNLEHKVIGIWYLLLSVNNTG